MTTRDYILQLDKDGRLAALPKKPTAQQRTEIQEALNDEAQEAQRRAKALRVQAELYEMLLNKENPDTSPITAPVDAPKIYHAPLRNLLDPYGFYVETFLEALLEYPRVYDSTGAAHSTALGALYLLSKIKHGKRTVYACELTDLERIEAEAADSLDNVPQRRTEGALLFSRTVSAFCNFLIKAERERPNAAPELAAAAIAIKKLAKAIEEQPYTKPTEGAPAQFTLKVRAVLSALEAVDVKLAASDYKEPTPSSPVANDIDGIVHEAAAKASAETVKAIINSDPHSGGSKDKGKKRLDRRLQTFHVYKLEQSGKTYNEAAEEVLSKDKLQHPITQKQIDITAGYDTDQAAYPTGGLGSAVTRFKKYLQTAGNTLASYFAKS